MDRVRSGMVGFKLGPFKTCCQHCNNGDILGGWNVEVEEETIVIMSRWLMSAENSKYNLKQNYSIVSLSRLTRVTKIQTKTFSTVIVTVTNSTVRRPANTSTYSKTKIKMPNHISNGVWTRIREISANLWRNLQLWMSSMKLQMVWNQQPVTKVTSPVPRKMHFPNMKKECIDPHNVSNVMSVTTYVWRRTHFVIIK